MMLLARQSLAAAVSAAVVTLLVTGTLPLGAQESTKTKAQATKAKAAQTPASTETTTKTKSGRVAPPDPTHRVPPGYSKLGLTDQQKDKIYAIQAEYYPKIQALEKQVDSLRARRETEFQKVLTPSQRQLLAQQEQQKKAAAEARKAAAKAAEKQKTGQ